jgi:hypothetical protein
LLFFGFFEKCGAKMWGANVGAQTPGRNFRPTHKFLQTKNFKPAMPPKDAVSVFQSAISNKNHHKVKCVAPNKLIFAA